MAESAEKFRWRASRKGSDVDVGVVSTPTLDGGIGPGSDDLDLPVDTDVDEGDDEIGPGCYILDIDIEGLPCSKIWIRRDHIGVYDYCNEHYNFFQSIQTMRKAPSLCYHRTTWHR